MLRSLLFFLVCVACMAVSVQSQCIAAPCSSCTQLTGCGWCVSQNRCVPGNSNGPSSSSSCPCTSFFYTSDQCGNFNEPSCASAAARNWVTAVWVTILVVFFIALLAFYIRRRRYYYYLRQAQAQQATIITTQTYPSSPAGGVVMANFAQPVMATMAQPVMAQPVYAPAPAPGSSTYQPMAQYPTPVEGQPMQYAPAPQAMYAPQAQSMYAPQPQPQPQAGEAPPGYMAQYEGAPAPVPAPAYVQPGTQ